jgi:pantoate--beta-alanine ligase
MTEVVRCPTVREPDGLALSSRNVHLAAEDRAAAPVIYRALVAGRETWAGGERDAAVIRARVGDVLATEPRAKVEYISCADDATLAELERIDGPAMLSLAVRFGATRLIDNVRLA